MSQKKIWSASAKLEIALLAIKGDMTIGDICKHQQVAPSQVHAWKQLIIKDGGQLFEQGSKSSKQKAANQAEKLQGQLYEKIGQLTIERDFLKKAWSKHPGLIGGK